MPNPDLANLFTMLWSLFGHDSLMKNVHFVSSFIPNWPHTNWVGKFSILVHERDLGHAACRMAITNPNFNLVPTLPTQHNWSYMTIFQLKQGQTHNLANSHIFPPKTLGAKP